MRVPAVPDRAVELFLRLTRANRTYTSAEGARRHIREASLRPGRYGPPRRLRRGVRVDVTHDRGRMFRAFADQTKSDRLALAACIRGSRDLVARSDMGKIAVPTLIGVGTKDDIAGSAQELAALMPQAQALDIPGRDHMLAVGDRVFKKAVLEFYGEL